MSAIDIQRLDARFKDWKKDRFPDAADDDAFEYYSVYQILKSYDLDDEGLLSGIIGGGDDGGADAVYLFINRMLMGDESTIPDRPTEMHLVVVQAKYSDGFKETPITKLNAFAINLFDFSKTPADIDGLKFLNTKAKDAIKNFRAKLDATLKHTVTFKVSFYYSSKSQNPPNAKQLQMGDLVRQYIKTQYTSADVEFAFWGCPELLSASEKVLSGEASLRFTDKFYTSKKHSVCLAKLNDFVDFLTGENGEIKTKVLEANVRDFQGDEKIVNSDIRLTLTSGDPAIDFWWLNNGITILAKECDLSGNALKLVDPKIVNGLQTSHVIFDEFRGGKKPNDTRQILVKVIVGTDEKTSTDIIKATNNQTVVQKVSLKAMEKVHFDIESKLKLIDLFYDRRKGKYRQQNKPVSKIISMTAMGQAVMSILLQLPDDARARPATALGRAATYDGIFPNDNYDLNLYEVCILIDRQVETFLADLLKAKTITADVRRDLKFYENMIVACELCKNLGPDVPALAGLLKAGAFPVDQKILKSAHDLAMAAYTKLGATEKIAKGSELKAAILKELGKKYQRTATLSTPTSEHPAKAPASRSGQAPSS